MSADIFDEHVLPHFESPYHRGSCLDATHRHRARNEPCGDEVELELRIQAGVIREAWFSGRGCIVSQAAASMLVQKLEGHTVSDAAAFTPQQMLELFRAPLTPTRRRCCLVAWEALMTVLRELTAKGKWSD